jgi:hypothetical protein
MNKSMVLNETPFIVDLNEIWTWICWDRSWTVTIPSHKIEITDHKFSDNCQTTQLIACLLRSRRWLLIVPFNRQ